MREWGTLLTIIELYAVLKQTKHLNTPYNPTPQNYIKQNPTFKSCLSGEFNTPKSHFNVF